MVDARVQDAVLAWARAEDLERSAEALRSARLALPEALLPELRAEVAQIAVEALLRVITKEPAPGEVDADGPSVEIEGMTLTSFELERVGAWRLDQKHTADALGLGAEAWQRMLTSAVQAMFDAPQARSEGGDSLGTERQRRARALIDAPPKSFERRGLDAKRSGVRGIIGALTFDGDDEDNGH